MRNLRARASCSTFRIAAIVVAIGLFAHTDCRRREEDAAVVGSTLASDSSPRTLDAAAIAIDPLDADATAMGPSIEVRLVRQLHGMNGTTRYFTLLLVVSGLNGGMLVVPIDGEGFAQDGESTPDQVPAGTLIAIAPQTPLTIWDEGADRIVVPVPVRAPLLYRIGFHIPGGNDEVAVVHNGDQLQVFYFWEDEGASATAWELQASVRLAPGARPEVH